MAYLSVERKQSGKLRRMFSAIKQLLPRGKRFRRVLFGPAAGAILPLDLQHEARLYLGVYERELWSAYRRLLLPGMKAFDIGGRDGYSALLIHRMTSAAVISFECDEGAAAEMQATFARNTPDILAVAAFVGGGLSLDDATNHYFRPAFLKIDVEGGEVDVLRSGPELLASRPRMIVEVHGVAEERGCVELLRPLAYDVTVVDQAALFPEQRPLAHNRWLVCE